MATDVDKEIYGSTVTVLTGEKLSVRILVSYFLFVEIDLYIHSSKCFEDTGQKMDYHKIEEIKSF